MFNIQENLKKLPAAPGVYLHKDKMGQVIYVGKAVSLRNRVRQYFQSSRHMDPKVRAMVGHIAEFEYITCGSEMEAFILECNLIKKYRPKYNVLLRDDKTYPYIQVTTSSERFPRVLKTRRIHRDGDRYFGPFSDAGAVNQMLDLLNQTYRLKRCSRQHFPHGWRPCLNYHIGQCDGVCIGKADRREYLQRITSVKEYLKGKDQKMTAYLQRRMEEESAKLNYEAAAMYRDYLRAARSLGEKQRVVLHHGEELDVVLSAGGGHIVLFYVREGKLVGRETYEMEHRNDERREEVVGAFLKLHYGAQTAGPSEILVRALPPEHHLIESYLSGLWSRKVTIAVPKRGEKRSLLELAKRDVAEMTHTIEERERNRREREEQLGKQMHQIFVQTGVSTPYDGRRYRVEAYDISNTNGVDTVGAMVVFEGRRPLKKAYRKFRIRTVEGQDDYSSMQEVLYRRLRRAEQGDPGFSVLPDALLIDGGKGHVAAVKQVTDAMHVSVPVLGMVKDDRHRTRALVFLKDGAFREEPLQSHPLLFQYMGTIQEEVHRFVIDYHRTLRDQGELHSVLEEIRGIGPARRNALLAYFGSVEQIRKAEIQDLQQVRGITARQAQAIWEYFHANNTTEGKSS